MSDKVYMVRQGGRENYWTFVGTRQAIDRLTSGGSQENVEVEYPGTTKEVYVTFKAVDNPASEPDVVSAAAKNRRSDKGTTVFLFVVAALALYGFWSLYHDLLSR